MYVLSLCPGDFRGWAFLPDLAGEFPICNWVYLAAEEVFVHTGYEVCAGEMREMRETRGRGDKYDYQKQKIFMLG